jgi:hypothetical protein
MRNHKIFPVLILLMALPLISFKSVEKDPRVISPHKIALVVASKPTTDKLKPVKKSVETKRQVIKTEINNEIRLAEPLKSDNTIESKAIYTVQTGSFTNSNYAREEFDFITEELNKNELDFLRIEKIGEFDAVRVGKFEDYSAAEKYLQAVKTKLDSAIIMKTMIKNKRIKRLYK